MAKKEAGYKKRAKLVYEDTKKAVRPKDVVTGTKYGTVTVSGVHAPKHGEVSHGRLTLTLEDGSTGQYHPGIINAIWL